jgi:hypothetical protein
MLSYINQGRPESCWIAVGLLYGTVRYGTVCTVCTDRTVCILCLCTVCTVERTGCAQMTSRKFKMESCDVVKWTFYWCFNVFSGLGWNQWINYDSNQAALAISMSLSVWSPDHFCTRPLYLSCACLPSPATLVSFTCIDFKLRNIISISENVFEEMQFE